MTSQNKLELKQDNITCKVAQKLFFACLITLLPAA